ncbi:Mur ligase [Aspergillus caelatus]|uniref:tetrahydrofolate synthase n=1 Tax=Aspergillus caelatus TaxID=61420 RepID=A0A5N7A9M3_9EURO|nr:Mur ligase [Aspergillus caelatus]KAE8366522.1 Mur ligase [Aspergillus caelatus]
MAAATNRIRINSEPISEELFFERGREVERKLGLDNPSPGIKLPVFLQMIALTAFHTFIEAKVDVVICEVHHGGEFDATNFIERPVITAITKIGIDHVDNLGGSLEHIAWHKSGIFKEKVPAFSVQQAPAAENKLRDRAKEKNVPLHFVKAATQAATLKSIPVEQQENCALAIQIVRGFLQRDKDSLENQDIKAGVEACYFPGRYEIINSRGCTWYVDGAHNETSLEEATKWYKRVADASATRVLVFANFSDKRTRDWAKLLDKLGHCLESLQMSAHHVIFVREIEFDNHFSITEEQLDEYADHWANKWPSSTVQKVGRVKEVLNMAEVISNGAQILVTGSLYLGEEALGILKDKCT